jgi:pimeloyl-ACP methyl ester carboxylesterase
MTDDADPGAPQGYDDRPLPCAPALPPEIQAPLAVFKGASPPAPAWFTEALAQAPERSFVTSKGSQLELLVWGERGRPGLLLVHGNSAHADWWSFIAPFLAKDFRVAAMSLAGMGSSDWRERYAFQDFLEDAEACARAAGLYEAAEKPVFIGHSFGGAQVFYAAARRPDLMRAAVLVDVGFGPPPTEASEREFERFLSKRPNRVYATLPEALARFRFMPPQTAGHDFVADFIARRSLRPVPLADGAGEGFTWRFDPAMWSKLDRSEMTGLVADGPPKVAIPVAHIYGERSALVEPGRPDPLPPRALRIAIPDAQHHVMVDQPLALVSAIRALLSAWPA